jgi:hypothetical protein
MTDRSTSQRSSRAAWTPWRVQPCRPAHIGLNPPAPSASARMRASMKRMTETVEGAPAPGPVAFLLVDAARLPIALEPLCQRELNRGVPLTLSASGDRREREGRRAFLPSVSLATAPTMESRCGSASDAPRSPSCRARRPPGRRTRRSGSRHDGGFRGHRTCV